MVKENIDKSRFIDQLPVGVCRTIVGPKGVLCYANPSFCSLFSFDPRKINLISISQLFVEARRHQQFVQKLTKEGFVVDFEARLKGKNKKTSWFSIDAGAIKDSRGKIQYFDIVVRDIAARKRYEKELIESKGLFETVFNNSAAAITVTDKHERIVAWNPFAEKMFFMDKKDFFNKPVKDLYPDKEWKRMRAFRIRKKGMLSDIETQVYRKDGSLLDVNVSISVLKDSDGHVIGSIGIIRDIAKQKLAEYRMKESENKIRVILDHTAAGITLLDDKERIISWNRFAEQLLGMKKEDLFLRPVSSLYPEDEWKKIRSENIRQMGSKHHLETKIIRKDGKVVDIDLSVNVLRDANDKIIGSVGIMQDITGQKKFQEMLVQAKLVAEEANSAKSLFLANMSHEVRTPMNTIIGMIDLTLDTGLNAEQKENLVVAKDAADNLLGLLNDILDLSRVEAGKLTLENIEFHLHNVIKSVIKGLSVLAKNKNLELALAIDHNVPELLEGDPIRLRQVLINLINNAIKFTHKGKITTEIKLASKSNKEVMLMFNVIDEGIGIPKNKQGSIFEVFTQADSSTVRHYGGTGLGLAISKRLVEMMGGRIWVESEEAKGSTFSFTANFKVIDSKATSAISEKDDLSEDNLAKQLNGLRILLAEDNLVNQKITIRLLEKMGCQIKAVENGHQVIDALNKDPFDVVLMDAHMPLLDGLAATKLIRDGEQKTGTHIPIIALTARAMQEDRKKCIEAGMDGYVAKPIDRKKLYEEIANIFQKGKSNE